MANKYKLQAIGDRVVVRRDEPNSTTKTGIILPDVAKEKPKRGTVVGVSDAVTSLKEGDDVIFSSFAGTEISVGDDKFVIIETKDVLARVKLAA